MILHAFKNKSISMDQIQSSSTNIGKWLFRHTNTNTRELCLTLECLQKKEICRTSWNVILFFFVCFLIIFNVGVLWTLTCSF